MENLSSVFLRVQIDSRFTFVFLLDFFFAFPSAAERRSELVFRSIFFFRTTGSMDFAVFLDFLFVENRFRSFDLSRFSRPVRSNSRFRFVFYFDFGFRSCGKPFVRFRTRTDRRGEFIPMFSLFLRFTFDAVFRSMHGTARIGFNQNHSIDFRHVANSLRLNDFDPDGFLFSVVVGELSFCHQQIGRDVRRRTRFRELVFRKIGFFCGRFHFSSIHFPHSDCFDESFSRRCNRRHEQRHEESAIKGG